MIAQVAGCREEDGYITAFVPDEDAEFWSVYLGESGGYECIQDFDNKVEAVNMATRLVACGQADGLDNRTFSKRRL